MALLWALPIPDNFGCGIGSGIVSSRWQLQTTKIVVLSLRTGVEMQKLEEVKVKILFFCKNHIGPVNYLERLIYFEHLV